MATRQRPGGIPGALCSFCVFCWFCRFLVHPSHAPTTTRHRRRLLLLPLLHHDALGREQQRRDRRRVLQGRTGDFGGVNHARGHEILETVGLGVVPEVVVLRLL